MANITNTLIANVTATEDSTQNVTINRTLSNLNFDSSVAAIDQYPSLPSGDNIIGLPIPTVFQLMVVNKDPALIITPKITPKGGVLAICTQLYPGDVMIIWQKPGSANGGITGLTLNASGAGALYEVFFGG